MMSYNKMIKLTIMSLLIPLILTACFSDNKQVKKSLSKSVESHLDREHYGFEGNLTLLNKQSDHPHETSWQWSGFVHDDPHRLFVDAKGEMNQEKISGQMITDGKTVYTHLPEFNHDGEFFVKEQTDEDDVSIHFNTFWTELANAAKETDLEFFRQSTEEDGAVTVQVIIEDEQKAPWYDAFAKTLASIPSSFEEDELAALFADQPLKQPGHFEVTTDEQGNISHYDLSIETDQFSFTTSQTLTTTDTTDPNDKVQQQLPWDDVMEQLTELLDNKQASSEGIPFESEIDWIQSYTYNDTARQSAQHSIQANLQALINRDKEAFDDTFRKDTFIERHDDLWNSERKYRFTQIEDLQFKKMGSDSIRVGVLYDYVDPGDQEVSTSAFIVQLRSNEQGEWKIDRIR